MITHKYYITVGVLEMVSKSDIVSDLKDIQIKKNSNDSEIFIYGINESIFQENVKRKFVQHWSIKWNCKSSSSASAADEKKKKECVAGLTDFCSVYENGRYFLLLRNGRYFLLLRKRKVFSFATEGEKSQMKEKKGNIVEVRMECGILRSILFLRIHRRFSESCEFKIPWHSLT